MPDDSTCPASAKATSPSNAFTISRLRRAFCIDYLDHHNLKSVNFFGHSLGGRIGLILAAEHSDRASRTLALSNSAGIREQPAMRHSASDLQRLSQVQTWFRQPREYRA